LKNSFLKEGDSPTVKAAGRFTAPSAPEFIARLDPALKGQDCSERAVQKDDLGGVRSPSQVAVTIPGLKAGVHFSDTLDKGKGI